MSNDSGPSLRLGDLDLTPMTTNSFVFTMSRDQAIMFGHERPTPKEVEEFNAESRERWERSVAQWALLDAAAAELAAISDPLARGVLDLHACAETMAECSECSPDDEEGYGVSWPCATVRLVAERFGVTLPEGYFGSRPGDAPHEMPPEGYQPFVPPLARWHSAALGEAFDRTVFEGDA